MGLGNCDRKIFLNINNGKVEKTANGKKQQYDYVEGFLMNIYEYERTFRNEKTKYWYIDIKDERGNIYAVGFPYSSGLFKTIILSLASDDALNKKSTIRLQPYEKNGYSKAVVWSDGVKLDWVVKELPPLKDIQVGGRNIKDDSDRMNLICKYVKEINARIQ